MADSTAPSWQGPPGSALSSYTLGDTHTAHLLHHIKTVKPRVSSDDVVRALREYGERRVAHRLETCGSPFPCGLERLCIRCRLTEVRERIAAFAPLLREHKSECYALVLGLPAYESTFETLAAGIASLAEAAQKLVKWIRGVVYRAAKKARRKIEWAAMRSIEAVFDCRWIPHVHLLVMLPKRLWRKVWAKLQSKWRKLADHDSAWAAAQPLESVEGIIGYYSKGDVNAGGVPLSDERRFSEHYEATWRMRLFVVSGDLHGAKGQNRKRRGRQSAGRRGRGEYACDPDGEVDEDAVDRLALFQAKDFEDLPEQFWTNDAQDALQDAALALRRKGMSFADALAAVQAANPAIGPEPLRRACVALGMQLRGMGREGV